MRRITANPQWAVAFVVLVVGVPLATASCGWLVCCDMAPSMLTPHCADLALGSVTSCCDGSVAQDLGTPGKSLESGVVVPGNGGPTALRLMSRPSLLESALAPIPHDSAPSLLFLLHSSLLN